MAFGRSDPNALVAAFASSDFSHDDAAWQAAVEEDRPPDELDIPEMDPDGNYTAPVFERVIRAYRSYLEDKSQRRNLKQVLDSAREGVEKLLNTMDLCLEEGLDDPNNPIHQAARAGFEQFIQGLDDLQDSVEQRNNDLAEAALEHLQQSTNRIMDAFGFFQKLRNVMMTVHCPACDAENRRGNAKCSACQAPIPQQESLNEGRVVAVNAEGVLQTETPPAPLTTPNYMRLDQAIHNWRQGALDDAGLWNDVAAVEANMSGHRSVNQAELEDLEGLTEEEQAITVRVLGSIDVALDGSLQALAEMKRFWEDGDSDHLDKGMAMLGPPTQKMIEAFLALQSISVEDE
ncbi:hypothetical protein IV102_20260 [bacterium]|nr:hypothetical protein [bacterium]